MNAYTKVCASVVAIDGVATSRPSSATYATVLRATMHGLHCKTRPSGQSNSKPMIAGGISDLINLQPQMTYNGRKRSKQKHHAHLPIKVGFCRDDARHWYELEKIDICCRESAGK